MPNIERYQSDILARLSAATSMKVSADKLKGEWHGFRPTISLENVVFAPAASTKLLNENTELSATAILSRESLSVPTLHAGLSWWSLAMGQPRFSNVQVYSPKLTLTRTKDGLIYFAGKAINQPSAETGDERLVEFLLDQPGAEIRNASLTWNDLLLDKTATFTDVNLKIEKTAGKHRFAFSAKPPAPLASLFDARAELQIVPPKVSSQGSANAKVIANNKDNGWLIQGKVFAQLGDINLDEVKQFVSLPDQLKSGRGNLRSWIDIDTESPLARQRGNPIARISADVNIGDTSVQMGDGLAPLQIAKLAGRIDYDAVEGGFKFGSRNLTFQTKEVIATTPADFSVSILRQDDPKTAGGEFTANAIDIKVVTSLLSYFPVGATVRDSVKRYAPQGLVNKTKFSWSGYLDALKQYSITSEVKQFGLNADGKTPGVKGFSGAIEATEKGGKITIASTKLELDLPESFKKRLSFDTVDAAAAWTFSDIGLKVDIARFALSNPDLAGEFSGSYLLDNGRASTINSPNKAPGTADIKGKFTQLDLRTVADYLPISIPDTRDYIGWALRNGSIAGGDFSIRGALFEFPFHNGVGGDFKLALKVRNATFRYAEGWPQVDAIDADFDYHNTKLGLKIDKAKIFNAEFKNAVVAIEDLKAPTASVKINGTANARAEDTLRFLRESPMIKNVGSFTDFLTLEGPGKLTLALSVPLDRELRAEQLTVNGNYLIEKGIGRAYFGGGAFAGNTSAVALGATTANPSISNIAGLIAFTNKSVKASNITATAFDNPLTVQISGGGENNVVTEISGRAAVAKLEEVLPYKLPAQVQGTINFSTKITPGGGTNGGVKVGFESNLVGLSSSLPAPMQKAESETRALNLVLNDAGSASERIQITVGGAGGGVGAADTPPITATLARFRAVEGADVNASGLYGGVINLNGGPITSSAKAVLTIPRGIYINGKLALLDFDAWRVAIANMYPTVASSANATATQPEESIFSGFDLTADVLTAFGRNFTTLKLKGRRVDSDWRATVESAAISGDVSWRPQAFGEAGLVRARLRNFVLADVAPTLTKTPAAVSVASEVNDVPALDIVAEKFVWKTFELGKLELVAAPKERAWLIDKMNISNGHATLETSGVWQRDVGKSGSNSNSSNSSNSINGSTTSLKTKLQVKNLNALFAQFNHADDVKGGNGVLEGTLSWPGHIYQYEPSRLSGEFKLEALAGRISKFEPGAGKLLGLMSLQSIPRRFSFDFRDLFSEGFAFDSINGDMKINSGVINTDNFEISGPAAKVKMVGEVNLVNETQNLNVTVRPAVSGVAALAAGLALANPLIGAALLVTQKVLQDPIDNVLAVRYGITGTWAEPITAKIDRQNTVAKSSADPVNPSPSIVK